MRHLLTTAVAALLTLCSSSAVGQSESDVRLGPQQWRHLNVFFSNFAEASVQPFQRGGEIPPATLIRFGFLHNLINADQRVQDAPGRPNHGRLSASHVEAAIKKYFGIRFSQHGSLEGIEYVNGYYVFPLADGETYPFAQVNSLTDLGNGEFAATLSVYQMSPGDDVDQYGTAVEQLRRRGYEVELVSEMRARIRQVREDGRDRYVLLEYLPGQ